MSRSPLPLLMVSCPKCGERLRVRAEDVGKRGQCRTCGATFRIGGGGDAANAGARPAKTDAPPGGAKTPASADVRQAAEVAKTQASGASVSAAELDEIMAPRRPASVTFPCSLCETRITAATVNVGKRVKCPDCGRANVVPEPAAKPQAAKAPAAMSGEQFGVWGVDEAPSSEEITARSPNLHPVVCERCQTLMYATDAQVGTKLKCPDCGSLTLARARQVEKPRKGIVPDGEEYELDEASAPPPRPVYRPIEMRGRKDDVSGEVEGSAPATRSVAAAGSGEGRGGESERGGESREGHRRAVSPRLREEVEHERPKMPAVPLVQGVSRMLFTAEILARWGVLSLTLIGAGWFLSWVFSAMSSMVFMAIPMFAIGCVFFALWLLSAMPLSLVIVTESSEGNDRLHDPPSWLSMDFAEAFFVVIAAAVSAFPAWLTLKLSGELPEVARAAIVAGTWLVFFPIVLLSNLEQSSAFAVFSPRLVSSLVRCAGPWLLFYIESFLLAAAWLAALEGIARGPTWLVYLAPFVAVAALLIYMRLIGRLAWWLAESMPAPAERHSD